MDRDEGGTDELAWETVTAETAYSCDGFDVVSAIVRLPDGSETDFDYVVEGESVVVIPFTPADDVVVIEEWRHAVGQVNCGLPAGSVEPDDDEPAAAVERELEEETGYEAGAVEQLTTVEPANGFADSVFHYFVARDCAPTGTRQLEADESIRVETTTFDALLDAARDGELRDGRSLLGICYYALFEEYQ